MIYRKVLALAAQSLVHLQMKLMKDVYDIIKELFVKLR